MRWPWSAELPMTMSISMCASVLLMELVGCGDEFVGNTVAIPPLKVPPGFEVQKVITDFVAYVAGVGWGVSDCRPKTAHRTFPAVEMCDGGIESPQCVCRSVEPDNAEVPRRGRGR